MTAMAYEDNAGRRPLRSSAVPSRSSTRAFIALSFGARSLRPMAAHMTYAAGGEPVAPADERPVVRARGLVKRYGEIVAVDNVDLAVPAGAVYGLLGPNGAGKTTFMRMLFGLIRPDAGSVELFGRAEVAGRVEALEDVAGFVE